MTSLGVTSDVMVWFLPALFLMQATDEVRVSSHPYVPKSPYTLRVDTKVVEIAAVVRDKRGKAVSGLTKDDFRILDDGKERVIDHFEVDNAADSTANAQPAEAPPVALRASLPATRSAPPPRFLALFIDDVNSTDESLAGGLKQTQTAAKKFVKDALKADVRIGVFTASGAQTQEFTRDEGKLIEAISALKAHVRMREQGLTPCPRITPYLAYRIASEHDSGSIQSVMFDDGQKGCPTPRAVIVSQAEETWRQVQELSIDTLNSIGRVVVRLGAMPGRRELLLASSGFLASKQDELKDKIIDRAIQAGVVINAMDSKGIFGEAPPGMRPEDAGFTQTVSGKAPLDNEWAKYQTIETPLRIQVLNEPMGTLAEGTGGIFYHNNNDLNAGFRKLGGEPGVTYRFSFRPDGVTPDGSYHSLKVGLVHSKNYEVQARPGYFAPDEKAPESLQSKIDREIMAEDSKDEFPVRIAVQRLEAVLSVVVQVDISKMRFAKQGDRQVQHIVFTTALLDAQGRIATAKEGEMDLALTEATYKALLSSGVKAIIHLPVSAGSYKLRQVSAETLDGKLACSTQAIEVK
jgi:VWFA-related protein